jgi:hypothetical protein
MRLPELQPQEIPLDHSDSVNPFAPGPEKPFVATPAAIALYTQETIFACLAVLRRKADASGGLDYLQVFRDPTKAEDLWFIEDESGGAITALLPSEH